MIKKSYLQKFLPLLIKDTYDLGASFLCLSIWLSLLSSSFYCSSIFGHWGAVLCTRVCVSRYVLLAEEDDTPLCVCVVCGWARECLAAHSVQ